MSAMESVDFNDGKELLRFTTAGSVDDGKSTLIGRLLYDSKSLYVDQLENLEAVSRKRGEDSLNLALITDGLRAEREQGITIDVAYRYFSTTKRKFIIADTPGHEQYTRNMVTGASTAQLAIVLIDSKNGVLTQSKRHAVIASLLGIPHLIVAVNKMDAVGYRKEVYDQIVDEFLDFSSKLNIHDITCIPISALKGDNVVNKSVNMAWYDGPTILHQLENVTITADKNLIDFRFPVQHVIRPNQDFRGYAGRIVSGTISVGDAIMVMPACKCSSISSINKGFKEVASASAGDSVIMTVADHIDIGRGDLIVRKDNIPSQSNHFEATLCWMDDSNPLIPGKDYILQHMTTEVRCCIRKLRYRLNINSLHRENCDHLGVNDIGRVEIETSSKVCFDPYMVNRSTGGFILIDPNTNLTSAAGMIRGEISADELESPVAPEPRKIVRENFLIDSDERALRNGHLPHCVWLTGLSGAGKSTIAKLLAKKLFELPCQVYNLDGDNTRSGLNVDLGFSMEDRIENNRRAAHVAQILFDAGFIVIASFISPLRKMRDFARSLFPEGSFSEVYVDCDFETCKRRDPKNLYNDFQNGKLKALTGADSAYEVPVAPDLVIDTAVVDPDTAVDTIINELRRKKVIK